MENKTILSNKFQNLIKIADEYKLDYLSANPFPNIEFENFFSNEFLESILEDFPNLENISSSEEYENKNEVKFANNDYKNFPKSIKSLIDFMNSAIFLSFLQKITSIDEKLISDPELNGGGLHEIKSGGMLKIHTDFRKHPSLDLDRRVNVLIYLNKDWKETYGGDLELWDKEMKYCGKRIQPNFNKIVIFSTTDFSNHGHPDPIQCPKDISRKSIALYYFSKGRPEKEVNNKKIKNKTYFKDRQGFQNEVFEKNEIIKNFFRKFKFYENLKRLEKKFFRKK